MGYYEAQGREWSRVAVDLAEDEVALSPVVCVFLRARPPMPIHHLPPVAGALVEIHLQCQSVICQIHGGYRSNGPRGRRMVTDWCPLIFLVVMRVTCSRNSAILSGRCLIRKSRSVANLSYWRFANRRALDMRCGSIHVACSCVCASWQLSMRAASRRG